MTICRLTSEGWKYTSMQGRWEDVFVVGGGSCDARPEAEDVEGP